MIGLIQMMRKSLMMMQIFANHTFSYKTTYCIAVSSTLNVYVRSEVNAATNQPVKDIFCQSGEHFIEIINNNRSDIKSHDWDEYCKGFLAGEIFGMPSELLGN